LPSPNKQNTIAKPFYVRTQRGIDLIVAVLIRKTVHGRVEAGHDRSRIVEDLGIIVAIVADNLAIVQRFVAAETLHVITAVHRQSVALADETAAGHDGAELRIAVPVLAVVVILQVVLAHIEAAPIVVGAKLCGEKVKRASKRERVFFISQE
jgi:hypothetical protein